MELRGRSVIVTGASRGIGRAIAAAFAAEQARLTLCARDGTVLEATAELIRTAYPEATITAVPADVTDPADAAALVRATVGAFGGVDVLVNNAGASVRDGDLVERWERSFDGNVIAALRLMDLAKPYLSASGQGAVVNISSIYGRESGGAAPYNASKAAQIAMSKAYALEWAREGIRVNSVAPGSVAFEGGSWARRVAEDPEGMRRFVQDQIPAGRFGRPEEIAAAVVFLASPRASWVIGSTLNVDGGQSRSNI